MNLNDTVTNIKGIGPKSAASLERLGIKVLEDFLYYFPKSYQDRRNISRIFDLREGESFLVKGILKNLVKGGYGRKSYIRAFIDDGSGVLEVLFFNAPYLLKSLKIGEMYEVFGTASRGKTTYAMMHPEITRSGIEGKGEIVPIYPLTEGIGQSSMRKWQRQVAAIKDEHGLVKEFLSEEILSRNRLCSLDYALSNIHFPKELRMAKEAAFRLVFDELFMLQLGLLAMKKNVMAADGIAFTKTGGTQEFLQELPFPLTNAQAKVIKEIEADMEKAAVMNRLVQGDVGSGKTAVAAVAAYKALKNGYSVLFMAPTEILAKQHFESFKGLFANKGIEIRLVTGSTKEIVEASGPEAAENGSRGGPALIIGTHALIQEKAEFDNIGLVITDEQHRFGVNQRKNLALKGQNPDVLVMTATPIPRTLAMILYGDLDHSIIDEMPPGRKPIMTKAISSKNRSKAYKFLEDQIKEGRQAYVVTPLIDESEVIEAKSTQEVYKEISEKYRYLNVGLLHGNMKQKEKDQVMEAFSKGKINILVSTLVIEVGINVPNATVMLIENAERFGLATLHQLRGRVGRGDQQSYCILVTDAKNEIALERAKVMEETGDGFLISEKDLELRGPGEFFGLKQHGVPSLKIADLSKHKSILLQVHKEAVELLKKDPELTRADNGELKKRVEKLFREQLIF